MCTEGDIHANDGGYAHRTYRDPALVSTFA